MVIGALSGNSNNQGNSSSGGVIQPLSSAPILRPTSRPAPQVQSKPAAPAPQNNIFQNIESGIGGAIKTGENIFGDIAGTIGHAIQPLTSTPAPIQLPSGTKINLVTPKNNNALSLAGQNPNQVQSNQTMQIQPPPAMAKANVNNNPLLNKVNMFIANALGGTMDTTTAAFKDEANVWLKTLQGKPISEEESQAATQGAETMFGLFSANQVVPGAEAGNSEFLLNQAKSKLTQDVTKIVDQAPESYYISSQDLLSLGNKNANDVISRLNLSTEEMTALRKGALNGQGVSVQIPSSTILEFTDKPYWAKLKSMFGQEPSSPSSITMEAKPNITSISGLLGDGEHTPSDVTNAVINSKLANTQEGQAIMKATLQAQKEGMNISIESPSGLGKAQDSATPPAVEQSGAEQTAITAKPEEVVTKEPTNTAQLPNAKTAFDTPEIIQAREQQASIPSTHEIDTPERIQLRENITNDLFKNGGYANSQDRPTTTINSNKRADIVTGLPASGKNKTLADPLVKKYGSMLIDKDEAKVGLPESKGGTYNGAVHGESGIIHEMLIKKSLDQGHNIVIPTLGSNLEALRGLRDDLIAKGYQVHLHHSEVSVETSATRAVDRFNRTGKFVDPDYIVNRVGLKPNTNNDILKGDKEFASYEKFNNEGTKPKLIERGTNPRLSEESGTGRRGISETSEQRSQSLESSKVNSPTEQAANDVREALYSGDSKAAAALHDIYTQDGLKLPKLEDLQKEIDKIHLNNIIELKAMEKELIDSSMDSNPEDPTNQLLQIARQLSDHFSRPGAKYKITGTEREYTSQDGNQTMKVGGNASQAMDRLINSPDIVGFGKNIDILHQKFDGVFTDMYNSIRSGAIDGADYGKFKEYYDSIKGSRIQTRNGKNVQTTGSKAIEQPIQHATSGNTIQSSTNPKPETTQNPQSSREVNSNDQFAQNGEIIRTELESTKNQQPNESESAGNIRTGEQQQQQTNRTAGNGNSLNPQPLYHGTNATFNKFDLNKVGDIQPSDWGDGIYFADRPDIAREFAKVAGGNIVMERYAPNIKFADGNKLIKDPGFMNVLDDGMGFKTPAEYLQERGYGGIKINHKDNGGWNEYVVYNPNDIVNKDELKTESNQIGEPEGNTPASATFKAELVPGLSEFFKEDIIPKVKQLGEIGSESYNIANPQKASEKAQNAASIIRKAKAEIANFQAVIQNKYGKYEGFFNKYSDEQNLKNVSTYERTGKFAVEPKGGDYSTLYKESLTASYEARQAFYGNNTPARIENYVRHAFKFDNEDEAAKGVSALTNFSRSLSASKGDLKRRTIDLPMDEALQYLKDNEIKASYKSTNPEALRQWSLMNSKKDIVFGQAWREAKAAGLITFVRTGGKIPQGQIALNDRAAQVFAPAEVHFGAEDKVSETGYQKPIEVGKYYADPAVSRIFNNAISQGLENNKLFRAIRGLTNTMNQFQLALPGFHSLGTTINAGVNDVALGLRNYLQLKPLEGTGKIIRGLTPGASIARYYFMGRHLMNDLKNDNPKAYELLKKYVNPGGHRLAQDQHYTNLAIKNMMNSFRNGNIIGAGIRFPQAAIEAIAHPLFSSIIPKVKTGAFLDLAANVYDRLPKDATQEEINKAMGNVGMMIDGRFGQVAYDNYFWNKTLKDITMTAVRSVGWDVGTYQQVGGGILVDPIKSGLLGKGRVNNKFNERVTDRSLYVFSLFLLAGTIGAVYQYLHTGTLPEKPTDFYAPWNGLLDAAGNKVRVVLPTYLKDIYSYSQNPLTATEHKSSPLLDLISSLLSNRDFYNNLITNPNDPEGKQIQQLGQYMISQMFPFSIQSAIQQTKAGANTEQKLESFFGINKAPAILVQSAKQQAASKAYEQVHGMPNAQTPEAVALQNLKNQARAEIKKSGWKNSPTFKLLMQNGTLKTQLQRRNFLKSASLTSTQRLIQHLPKGVRQSLSQ